MARVVAVVTVVEVVMMIKVVMVITVLRMAEVIRVLGSKRSHKSKVSRFDPCVPWFGPWISRMVLSP